jgi:hypothetical protein
VRGAAPIASFAQNEHGARGGRKQPITRVFLHKDLVEYNFPYVACKSRALSAAVPRQKLTLNNTTRVGCAASQRTPMIDGEFLVKEQIWSTGQEFS